MPRLPDPIFPLLLSLLLALLFAHAATTKLRARAEFGAVLDAYDLAPRALTPLLSVLLPLAEGALALALPCPRLRAGAGLAAGALLALYALAIAINLVRGRRELDCGCTGPGERRPIAAWMVWRNALLALGAAALALPVAPRALGLADALTVLGGLAGFSFLYLALDRLYARAPASPGASA